MRWPYRQISARCCSFFHPEKDDFGSVAWPRKGLRHGLERKNHQPALPNGHQGQNASLDTRFPPGPHHSGESRNSLFPTPSLGKRHTLRQRFESTSLHYHDERDGKTNKGSPAVYVCRRHRPLDHRFQLGDITSRMQKQLNETAKFLFANGFKLSSSKSQAVLFRRNRMDANVKLSIGNELLSLSNTATFLGMPWELSLAAHGERVGRAYFRYTEPPSDLHWTMDAKQLIWETNESRASRRRSRRRLLQSAAAACMKPALHHYRWSVEILHTIFAARSSWRIMLSEQLQIITKQAIVIFF